MGFQSDFVQITGGPVTYYTEYTTTNLYVEKSFGRTLTRVTITNDSATDTVQFSYDGATLEGDLKSNESITVHLGGKTGVYIKGTAGGGNVRIWGS
jgi:hypothetical protein